MQRMSNKYPLAWALKKLGNICSLLKTKHPPTIDMAVEEVDLARDCVGIEEARKHLQPSENQASSHDRYGSRGSGSGSGLVSHKTAFCEPTPPRCGTIGCPLSCDLVSKFRTMDGTCNNAFETTWGATFTPHRRLLPPKYEDDISEPRGGKDGKNLPNVRQISRELHSDVNFESSFASLMTMQMGQFLDHDITFTPHTSPTCCVSNPLKECFTIDVSNDPFYSAQGRKCLEFHRSEPCGNSITGRREQFNDITAFVDASQVYGTNPQIISALRTFSKGLLKVYSTQNGDFLPKNTLPQFFQGAFMAGDIRVDEQPGLAALHNLFVREHNRIAKFVSYWTGYNDEKIYQITRRIVIAELQQVVYGEYLPVLLGEKQMNEFKLNVFEDSVYDVGVDPTITNSFATAAFRFGHSMVQGVVKLINSITGNTDSYILQDHFFDGPNDVFVNDYEDLLTGLTRQPAQNRDRFIVRDLTDFLFKEDGASFEKQYGTFSGQDLASLNLQRGRDHGIPGYDEFRCLCGLKRIGELSEHTPPAEITETNWKVIAALYKNAEDIDLFAGAMAEEPAAPDAVLGPTLSCIIGEQFHRLRFGDRFFFTHLSQVESGCNDDALAFVGNGLRKLEREIIRKRRLRDIICDNTNIKQIQINAFKLPSYSYDHLLLNTD
ncbi:unnamed protein product [Cyprideis torosa]|uniref:Uncharacterized protein n=1 Tax=Cyprideis torosa TaxID=163714 RepID=A0A7R8WGN9_9CRUS|nr:unnamed protein product [Cyprideis torosa]CAG0892314.1 unnamed protein product [Cyprideis torosa]